MEFSYPALHALYEMEEKNRRFFSSISYKACKAGFIKNQGCFILTISVTTSISG